MLATANQVASTIDWDRLGAPFRGRVMTLRPSHSTLGTTLLVLFGAGLAWDDKARWFWIRVFAVAVPRPSWPNVAKPGKSGGARWAPPTTSAMCTVF